MSPAKRGRAVEHVGDVMGISERRACRAVGQSRSKQRHERKIPDDEERLVSQIVRLATQYGRYGYRRITALLRNDGWRINHKRVERLWRREGLKVPQKYGSLTKIPPTQLLLLP
jgi:transposase InsO family protein